MKKRILFVIVLFICFITVCKASSDFKLNMDELFKNDSKNNDVISAFNPDYNIQYSVPTKNEQLEEKIKTLAKKTTFLLFGDFNNTNESSENFYRRKQDFFNLGYSPDIPKDAEGKEDTKSQEYIDSSLSYLAMNQIFPQAADLGLLYNSFGDIRVTIVNDNYVICSVSLPNVKIRIPSEEVPMDYVYKNTNYVMHYYYKQYNNEWWLYYFYGEAADDLAEYFNEIEESKSKVMAIAPSYNSELSNIYNFDKLKKVTNSELKKIYDNNVNSVVTLKSFYNNYIVTTAKGFFINDNLIITTWNFLEKSLVNSQFITISGKDTLEFEGIVTINPENDIVVLKVKGESEKTNISQPNSVEIEDPAFIIDNESGVGSMVQTGIIISNTDGIQTSIPVTGGGDGAPLFNQNGQVIGMITSESLNSSISKAVNVEPLIEIHNKFDTINADDIKVITFEELKEKYYYVNYNDEKITNDIPESKWKVYSKIGDIKEAIKMELIKASYSDNIISLRYKNGISNIISSMQLAAAFKDNLVKSGYQEITNSSTKCIYRNNEYQVIIMDEFDYLIVVMVKL